MGRTYRYMSDPLFPFGFGMSYTTFSIGRAKLNKTAVKVGETVRLTIPVINQGKRDGTEIVQAYVRKVNDPDGPLKTLKGFQRIELAAGKTGQAVIELSTNSFEFFDRESMEMIVAPGEYEVMYGNSSDDKDLKTEKITIK